MYTPPHIEPRTDLPGIFTTLRDMRRNALSVLPKAAYQEDIISGTMGPRRWHLVQEPEAMKRIFLDNVDNYPKSSVMVRMLRPAAGNSLMTASGDDWRWQRRAIAPVFTSRNVRQLAPMLLKSAEITAARISKAEQPVNIAQEMLAATLDVICELALSGREHFDTNAYSAALTRYLLTVGRPSLLDFLDVPIWVPRPGDIRGRPATRMMHRMLERAIEARRREGPGESRDLLDRMLAASDPLTGRRMDKTDLLHNLQFFIVAGHETTSVTLAWALYMLAHDEAAQGQARAEARAAINNGSPETDDVEKTPFLTQVFQEAMRLYPPVGQLTRDALEGDTLCGHDIRPRDIVFANIYALHRHERLWTQPNAFQPARFADEAVRKQHRYQYLPFGGGPRICVGINFAMMQAQLMLKTLLSRFTFTPAPPVPTPVLHVSIRPQPGVYLHCH